MCSNYHTPTEWVLSLFLGADHPRFLARSGINFQESTGGNSTSPPGNPMASIGVIVAAVPTPKASVKAPDSAPAFSSATATFLSSIS